MISERCKQKSYTKIGTHLENANLMSFRYFLMQSVYSRYGIDLKIKRMCNKKTQKGIPQVILNFLHVINN